MTDVVAALIWEGDKFLACQRPAHKTRPLLWEFVGGKVEPGETPQEALIRECREELAVRIEVGEIFMEVIHEYPDLTVRLTLFNASIADGTPQKLEHNDIRWITTAQIDSLSFCPADKDILKVLKSLQNRLQAELFAHADKTYRAFHSALVPTMDPGRLIGVRMPVLRKLSKRITDISELGPLPHRYYEEDCLHGLLINSMKDFDAVISALDTFLPHVDNWAVCDLLAPKAFQKHPAGLIDHVRRWLGSDHTYMVRFGIGVLMKYYLDDSFLQEYAQLVAGIRSDEYYVRMMIAWYFATALAKQYDTAVTVLQKRELDPWTHNKTIQKACESYRISAEQKAYLRTLKYKLKEGIA